MKQKITSNIFWLILLFVFGLFQDVAQSSEPQNSNSSRWLLKSVRKNGERIPTGLTEIPNSGEPLWPRSLSPIPELIRSFPRFHAEEIKVSDEIYEETLWNQAEVPENFHKFLLSPKIQFPGAETRVIIEQGPAKNRICLTFLGDGYSLSEKEKFFKDVELLVDDLFNGKTFASYRSLFNVYAIFTPSNESGITDLKKKDTVFGLYREPAGSKRAIMPGKTSAIDQALRLAPKTDYPIVVANDDFYGGLGGQYAITTSSRHSGKIVLRHELGHNFGNVGEEYDGGQVYTGANSSRSPQTTWGHWSSSSAPLALQDMRFLGGSYVWKNLNSGPVQQKFNFPQPIKGQNFWFEVQISSVGWETLNEVEVRLDGSPLLLEGQATADRSFFSTQRVQNLSAGDHVLEIRELNHDGDNILAFAELYAYSSDYEFSNSIGAYKTYDQSQRVSYRPTHHYCLMRDMLYENFCAVDQENMWLQFFKRIRILDRIETQPQSSGGSHVIVQAIDHPGVLLRWFQRSASGSWIEVPILLGQRSSDLPRGSYKITAQFQSSEVRKTSPSLMDEMTVDVP